LGTIINAIMLTVDLIILGIPGGADLPGSATGSGWQFAEGNKV
jgi:hypothetical protein